MTDELAFVRAILAEPLNPQPRLVYADWLEEQGGTQAAMQSEYLRLEHAIDSLTAGDPRKRLQARLEQLREILDADWWRNLDRSPVAYCRQFEHRCPLNWSGLLPTNDPAVRHCESCQQNVHYCRQADEARRRAGEGECVVIDSRTVSAPLELIRLAELGSQPGRMVPRASAYFEWRQWGPAALEPGTTRPARPLGGGEG